MRYNTLKFLCLFGFSTICLPMMIGQSLQIVLEHQDLGCIADLSQVPEPNTEGIEVLGGCRGAVVRHVKDLAIRDEGCDQEINRIYRAEDACGNHVQDTQTISFVYDTSPKPDQDVTVYIDLGCNPNLSLIPDPLSYDPGYCNARTSWLGDSRDEDGCYKSLIRKYEVFYCGGSYILTQIYNWIEDMDPPEISCPEDIHFGCEEPNIPPADPSQVKAIDKCCLSEVVWLGDIIVDDFESCEHIRIRKYQATDCCGNTSVCEQKFTWYDFPQAPEITQCPEGAFLGCNIDLELELPEATPELVEVSSPCSEVEVTAHLSDITIFGCRYAISWVYVAEDRCGNTSTCLQTFTWMVDEEPPTILHCPEDLDLGCNPVERGPFLVSPDFGIDAEDNCGIFSIKKVSTSPVEEGDDCLYYYYINYEVEDSCGNISSCQQRVFWREDLEDPVIVCPPDLDLGCDPEVVPSPDPSLVEASDNCGVADVSLTASSINNIDGLVTITRTYTATDHCGNSTSCDQVITYREFPPVSVFYLCPEDVDYGCVEELPEIPEPLEDETVGPEICPATRVHAGDDIQALPGCEYILTRYYHFINCCDDTITCVQSFEWREINTDSVIPLPEDQVVFCNIPALPDFVQAGLCGPGIPIFDGEQIIGDCSDGNCTIKRFWKSKGCESSLYISHLQTIEVKCEIIQQNFMPSEPELKEPILTIYPNPAQEILMLDLSVPRQIGQIAIIDMGGVVVKQLAVNEIIDANYEISIDDLSPGMYQVATYGSTNLIQRFIKM